MMYVLVSIVTCSVEIVAKTLVGFKNCRTFVTAKEQRSVDLFPKA